MSDNLTSFKSRNIKESFIPNLRNSVCLSFSSVLKYCLYDAGARSRTVIIPNGFGGRGEGSRTKKKRAVLHKQEIFRKELKINTFDEMFGPTLSVVKHLNTEKSESVGCINKERNAPPTLLFTCPKLIILHSTLSPWFKPLHKQISTKPCISSPNFNSFHTKF